MPYFTRSWPQKFIQLKGFKFSNRAICVCVLIEHTLDEKKSSAAAEAQIQGQ